MSLVYELGPFRLDVEAAVLTHAGVPMALGSRGVAVLRTLVERANEYVPKASIIDAAWPGLVVEESNLAVQISAIRRVLAQTPGGDRWIETLARRGYRFVGPVIEGAAAAHAGTDRECSNLPEPFTSFVGREREVIEVKRLLSTSRLVTLTGVGGIGKTRLALEVAAEVLDAYRDGVWLADFAALVDPAFVPMTLAQALAVQEHAATSLVDTLRIHLRRRQTLLVFDNCEHLLPACAALAEALLHGAPRIAILATSREPLGVDGERVYALPPLSLPEPSTTVEAIARSDAVQLFIERARRQQPDFGLSVARAPIVAALCVHLDGIPLALELAAARVRSLSVEQILARIDDRFRLLASGSRTALPRQQTLRATLDWSFDLLAEDERTVLRRLAVFAGGFTLDAASAVASDDAIDEYAVVDVLTRLVARSLVNADTIGRAARYRLLETTRAYLLEKLAEADEVARIRHRHARFFSDLFAPAGADWLRMADVDWRAIYPPELDNVRAALDWAFGTNGDREIATALAGASGPMWPSLSLHSEGVRRVEAAARFVDVDTPAAVEARLCLSLGHVLEGGMRMKALEPLQRAVELYRRLDDAVGLGYSLIRLADALAFVSRHEDSARVFAEALPVVERAGLPKMRAAYFRNLAFLNMQSGDLAAARAHLEKALSDYRRVGADSAALAVLASFGDVAWALGDLDAALAALHEATRELRKVPMPASNALGVCLVDIAGVHAERAEFDEALAAAREGLPLLQETGFRWKALDPLALRVALAGSPRSAARIAGYADSVFVARKVSRERNEARARDRLQAILSDHFAAEELERILAEGALMSEDEAVRLALEE